MCGIYCSVSRGWIIKPGNALKEYLINRGPDSLEERTISVPGPTSDITSNLTFVSTVLALRGQHVQVQPLYDEATGSVLCWNGEAWKVGTSTVEGNDSLHVFQLLSQASIKRDSGTAQNIVTVLNSILGPFAFTYYDALDQKLYFGRDRLGRRSLLSHNASGDDLILSSVCNPGETGWSEVTYDGVHVVDIRTGNRDLSRWHQPLPPINELVPPTVVVPLHATSSSVEALERALLDSIRLRVADIPSLGGFGTASSGHSLAKVAVLFSGGLDCTVLAALVHEILDISEPVDLLNVAFENPRAAAAARSDPNYDPYESCPDRGTGRRSFLELCKICPGRPFRFVAINIPYMESQAHRSTIVNLMHPQNTEMDLSIGMALYFAARGIGQVGSPQNHENRTEMTQPYRTTARVLLSGLGADELFAGYTRHASAFSRQGYPGLISELSLDITRLGYRNLGRDDRVISHWNKEARYPYLDEDLVRWALGTPVWQKCGFGEVNQEESEEAAIEPAKKALRLLAHRLGLKGVAREKKRAIQFGAKTAKMEAGGGRTKGTDLLS